MNRAIVRMSGLAGVLCAGPILCSPAAGAEFSWQVSGSHRDDADANTLESNRSALTATYFFSPVDDETGPYELALFLNRASRLTVSLAQSKQRERLLPATFLSEAPDDFMLPDDFVPFESTPALIDFSSEVGIDTSDYAVYGRYVWPGSGWYAGARVDRGDVDQWPQVPYLEEELALEGSGLFAGKYFGSRTAVELEFGSSTFSQKIQPRTDLLEGRFGSTDPIVRVSLFGADTETETEDLRLSLRHVGELGGLTYLVSASVGSSGSEFRTFNQSVQTILIAPGATDLPTSLIPYPDPELPSDETHRSERESRYGLSGALFPTDALGVHLTYSRSDKDPFGSRDLVGVSATWFFVRKAAAKIELARSRNNQNIGSGERDSVFVRLLGRF